jgi:hypothetical protein
MVYSVDKKLRGHAKEMVVEHTVKKTVHDRKWKICYHYELDDSEARSLVESGEAQQLTAPYSCLKEQRSD